MVARKRNSSQVPRLNDRQTAILKSYNAASESEWHLRPCFTGGVFDGDPFEDAEANQWELYCPWLSNHPFTDGAMYLPTDTLLDWYAFRRWAMTSFQIALGDDFREVWCGTESEKGLLTLLTLRIHETDPRLANRDKAFELPQGAIVPPAKSTD